VNFNGRRVVFFAFFVQKRFELSTAQDYC
jgi:hypothetical protein